MQVTTEDMLVAPARAEAPLPVVQADSAVVRTPQLSKVHSQRPDSQPLNLERVTWWVNRCVGGVKGISLADGRFGCPLLVIAGFRACAKALSRAISSVFAIYYYIDHNQRVSSRLIPQRSVSGCAVTHFARDISNQYDGKFFPFTSRRQIFHFQLLA